MSNAIPRPVRPRTGYSDSWKACPPKIIQRRFEAQFKPFYPPIAADGPPCDSPLNRRLGRTMPEDWSWDETLFAGTAEFYARGRVPYPAELQRVFVGALGVDGAGRLLDVGCGPGTVALILAPFFREVVGVDADRGMIAEATRVSGELRLKNVSWVCMRAEGLPAGLGVFDVATFAASFHWMDRRRVAALMFEMLAPGGAFVQVDSAGVGEPDGAVVAPALDPEPPEEEIGDLVRAYLGPIRRAGQGLLRHGTPAGESEVVMSAGFRPPSSVFVGGGGLVRSSVDDIVASVFSTSGSAPHLFGDRLTAFESDLRSLLRERSSSGWFSRRIPYTQLRIWRKPS